MRTELGLEAIEKSTYIVQVDFEDEYGDPVTPSAITWTLTDIRGTVINSRTAVAVSVPASTIYIVLSGLDLAVGIGSGTRQRLLTVEATYNSVDNGSNLPIKDEVMFTVRDLKKVS